jgi:hypothetical protein
MFASIFQTEGCAALLVAALHNICILMAAWGYTWENSLFAAKSACWATAASSTCHCNRFPRVLFCWRNCPLLNVVPILPTTNGKFSRTRPCPLLGWQWAVWQRDP